MLPLSVLTLALLGGFVFVNQCYLTRYRTLQSVGYRLVFASAIAGVSFLFLATVLSPLLLDAPGGQYINDWWHEIVPLRHSGKATWAFLFGATLWIPLNLLGRWNPRLLRRWSPFNFLSDGAAVKREIQRKQNPLEVLLREALGSGSLVSITVKNGKVYIGKVLTTSNPAFGMEAINILLSRSGHRDKTTQKMNIDINYDETHKAIREDLADKVRAEFARVLAENPDIDNTDELLNDVRRRISGEAEMRNYEIVIPISEVQSVNIFDLELYEKYFAPKEGESRVKRRRR